jgi:hypothetical protein
VTNAILMIWTIINDGAHPARICSHRESEARIWSALAVSFEGARARSGVDRHVGGCCLGDPLLRKIRLSNSWSQEKDRLLKKYWTVPEPQIETSVVLADPKWQEFSGEA